MRDRNIRWKKGDRISLGIAISKFNKKINELKQSEDNLNLPDELDYKKLSNEIATRTSLNTNLQIIRSFLSADVADLKVDEKTQIVSNWQKEKDQLLLRNARRYIKRQLNELEPGFGMGNQEYNELKSTLNSFNNLYKSKSTYKDRSEVLNEYGYGQKMSNMAKTFKENFVEVYSKSSFKNKQKLIDYANSFDNPQDFWNTIKDSKLSDLKQEYDTQQGLISFGDDEDNFNYELRLLKIIK